MTKIKVPAFLARFLTAKLVIKLPALPSITQALLLGYKGLNLFFAFSLIAVAFLNGPVANIEGTVLRLVLYFVLFRIISWFIIGKKSFAAVDFDLVLIAVITLFLFIKIFQPNPNPIIRFDFGDIWDIGTIMFSGAVLYFMSRIESTKSASWNYKLLTQGLR